MDPGRRDAVGSLITAWSSELGAMSYVRIPSTLDVMLLTAAVDNRKEIEDLTRQIELLRSAQLARSGDHQCLRLIAETVSITMATSASSRSSQTEEETLRHNDAWRNSRQVHNRNIKYKIT